LLLIVAILVQRVALQDGIFSGLLVSEYSVPREDEKVPSQSVKKKRGFELICSLENPKAVFSVINMFEEEVCGLEFLQQMFYWLSAKSYPGNHL
jgi:hypothetical protein